MFAACKTRKRDSCGHVMGSGFWVLGSGTSDDGRFDMRTSGVFRELNLSPSCQPIRAEEASRG